MPIQTIHKPIAPLTILEYLNNGPVNQHVRILLGGKVLASGLIKTINKKDPKLQGVVVFKYISTNQGLWFVCK